VATLKPQKERTQDALVTLYSKIYNFGGEGERDCDLKLEEEESRGAEPVV